MGGASQAGLKDCYSLGSHPVPQTQKVRDVCTVAVATITCMCILMFQCAVELHFMYM